MLNSKNIILLGATGSIGKSTLNLLRNNRDKFNLNVNLIKFHDIIENNDYQKLEYYDVIKKQDWDGLKNIFNEMSFNSIIGKEKSWNNYTNAFNNLFKEK